MNKVKYFVFLSFVMFAFAACKSDSKPKDSSNSSTMNPFFEKFNTPYEVPPFDLIKNEHYLPAFDSAMAYQNEAIKKIVTNTDSASFQNTIEALEFSNLNLQKVNEVFFNVLSTNSTDELQALAKEISPKLSAHSDDILLNANLFKKIKSVYEKKETLGLNTEQKMLLSETYKNFVRGGINLDSAKQTRLKEINGELSGLTLEFGQHLLNEAKNFKLLIEAKDDLAGLPQSSIDAAAEKAATSGDSSKWLFTIDKPTLIPFLQFSAKRELRQKMFEGFAKQGDKNDVNDNKSVINKLVNLRLEKANLLGFDNYADYILDDRMAKNTANVYELLDKLWTPALKTAKKEAGMLQAMLIKDLPGANLEPWDWWFYAEKLRKEKYDLDEESLKPYFSLDNSLSGLFTVLKNLYGLEFVERQDIPKYHSDVKVFEVKEADGKHVGIIYMDFYVREGKGSGAWMTSFRKQYAENGERKAPVISTVFNFPPPTGDTPTLLTFEEVSTIYHEMGHALHGLLSNVTYYSISGTATARDFVELPSQILENWAGEPEVLRTYAKHYKTDEIIPDALIKKMEESSLFNQGFATVEYLAASYLDMNWHSITKSDDFDVTAFENAATKNMNLIDEIIPRYRSTYFSHIFRGGYAVGYYSYVWAEVLDADAFAVFKEKGIFDPETAKAFRTNILEKGGSVDQMELYKTFKGGEPNTDALLKRKGFL